MVRIDSPVTESVEEMLELFTAPERLDKHNKFTCSSCDKQVCSCGFKSHPCGSGCPL